MDASNMNIEWTANSDPFILRFIYYLIILLLLVSSANEMQLLFMPSK